MSDEHIFFRSAVDGWRQGSLVSSLQNTTSSSSDVVQVKDEETSQTYSVRHQNIQKLTPEDYDTLAMSASIHFDGSESKCGRGYPAIVQAVRTRYYSGLPGLWIGADTLLWTQPNPALTLHPEAPTPSTVLKHALYNLVALKIPQTVTVIGEKPRGMQAPNNPSVSVVPALCLNSAADVVFTLCAPQGDLRNKVQATTALLKLLVEGGANQSSVFSIEVATKVTRRVHVSVTHVDVEALLLRPQGGRIAEIVRVAAKLLESDPGKTQLNATDLAPFSPNAENVVPFENAIRTLGIDATSYVSILKCLIAGAIYTTKIDFVERADGTAGLDDPKKLEALGVLFDVPAEKFSALFPPTLTLGDAELVRQSLIEGFYLTLVNYTVSLINKALSSSHHKGGSGSEDSHGLVDLTILDAECGDPGDSTTPALAMARNILVEDVWQTYVQNFEVNSVAQEKEGLHVPEYESDIEAMDNYSLLKLLKGKGGILEVINMNLSVKDATSEITNRYRKHPRMVLAKSHSSSAENSFTVRHLHNAVTYYVDSWKERMDDTVFTELHRALTSSKTSGIHDAGSVLPPHSTSKIWLNDTTSLGTLLADNGKSKKWWVVTVQPSSDPAIPFSGIALERSLKNVCAPYMLSVAHHVSGRICAVGFDVMTQLYGSLSATSSSSSTGAHGKSSKNISVLKQISEDACTNGGLSAFKYAIGRHAVLIHPRALFTLHEALFTHKQHSLLIVQTFSNFWYSSQVVFALKALPRGVDVGSRGSSKDQDGDEETQRNLEAMRVVAQRQQRENTLLAVLVAESKARQEIRAQENVDRVALQTQNRQLRKALIHFHVVKSIEAQFAAEQEMMEAAQQKIREESVDGSVRLTARLSERGNRLDRVIEQRILAERKLQMQRQRADTGKQKLLHRKVEDVRKSMSLAQTLEEKEKRKELIQLQRKKEMEQKQYDNWLIAERDKEQRLQKQHLQEAWEAQQREDFQLDSAETALQKRLEQEFREHLRRKREQERIQSEIENSRQQRLLEEMTRRHAFRKFKEDKVKEKQKLKEEVEMRRKAHAAWQIDAEQRKVREMVEKKQQRQKQLSERRHLSQQRTVATPLVYEMALSKLCEQASQARSVSEKGPTVRSPRIGGSPRFGGSVGGPMSPLGSPLRLMRGGGGGGSASPLSLRIPPVDGFVMSGYKGVTAVPIVHDKVWEGLLGRAHDTVDGVKSPRSPGAFSL